MVLNTEYERLENKEVTFSWAGERRFLFVVDLHDPLAVANPTLRFCGDDLISLVFLAIVFNFLNIGACNVDAALVGGFVVEMADSHLDHLENRVVFKPGMLALQLFDGSRVG